VDSWQEMRGRRDVDAVVEGGLRLPVLLYTLAFTFDIFVVLVVSVVEAGMPFSLPCKERMLPSARHKCTIAKTNPE